jgi:ABC-2 type transport system permease protein
MTMATPSAHQPSVAASALRIFDLSLGQMLWSRRSVFLGVLLGGPVLLGKYLAYLACTILLVLPSVMIVFFLVVPIGGGSIAAAFPSLLADLAMLAIGLASYGALFAWVGTRLKRPLVIGLVFAFGWEPGVLLFPGYLKKLTVAYYLQALVTHEMPQDSAVSMLMQLFHEVPTLATSLISLALIVLLTLWAAGRAVESKEYVLEQ